MTAWGCPHDSRSMCQKVAQRSCDSGMKGCVLAGRYVFENSDEINKRLYLKPSKVSAGEQPVANYVGDTDR